MRWKLVFENSKLFSCCWCCHVRTGTVIFGICWLLLQVTLLSMFAVFVLRYDLITSSLLGNDSHEVEEATTDAFGIPEANWNVWWMKQKNWNDDDKFVAALLAGGSIAVTLMLIHGAIKGRPGYMMPFMGLQVFDFCLTSLTVVSYLSDVPYVKRWLSQLPSSPVKDYLMNFDSDWLILILVLLSVGILVIKAYLMGIVWSCYKYLTQQERTANQLPSLLRPYDADMVTSSEDIEVLLPPKYEEVAQMPPPNIPLPPAYTPN